MQSVAVRGGVYGCVARRGALLRRVVLRGGVARCTAARCLVAAWTRATRCVAARRDMAWRGVWWGMVSYGDLCCVVAWCDAVLWRGALHCGAVCCDVM